MKIEKQQKRTTAVSETEKYYFLHFVQLHIHTNEVLAQFFAYVIFLAFFYFLLKDLYLNKVDVPFLVAGAADNSHFIYIIKLDLLHVQFLFWSR